MLAHLAISSALISSSLAVLAPSAVEPTSPALITPGPQIELLRRQNNDRFMGWLELLPNQWTSMTCSPGNTFYQTAGYWACCATTRAGCAAMVVGCVNGNMIYSTTGTGTGGSNGLLTRPCTSIWTASEDNSYTVCNTGFLYENSLDSNPKSNIFCGVVNSNWSYYRQQPATAITSSSRSSRSNPSSTPTSTPAVTTPLTLIPTAPITDSTESKKSSSKAWIAGVVIGPLLGLALIGLGIFFFLRRKKSKSASAVAPTTGSVGPAPTAYQQTTTGYPTDHHNNNAPPGYYPPMQQQQPPPQAGAGFVPMGVKQQDGYYGHPNPNQPPVSPMSPGSQSPNMQQPSQQWQQPVYGAAPSPSMSPAPPHVQPAQYNAAETRPFSSELQGSVVPGHGAPEVISVLPKTS